MAIKHYDYLLHFANDDLGLDIPDLQGKTPFDKYYLEKSLLMFLAKKDVKFLLMPFEEMILNEKFVEITKESKDWISDEMYDSYQEIHERLSNGKESYFSQRCNDYRIIHDKTILAPDSLEKIKEIIRKFSEEDNSPLYSSLLFVKWSECIEKLSQDQKTFMLKKIIHIFNTSESLEEKSNIDNIKKPEAVSQINLYTEESFKKFEKYVEKLDTDNGRFSKKFFKGIKDNPKINKRRLATSSLMLSKIDELYKNFPHFNKVIEHIEKHMLLQEKGDKNFYVPPLLLAGGAGVGKTFFSNQLAQLVNTPFEVLDMASMSAGFILTGIDEVWQSARPGRIFSTLVEESNPNLNPIFLLDEIDKAQGSDRYPVANTLLPLLEKYSAKKFKDECIPLEIDASHIVWFATANNIESISNPIKSRFDIFHIPNPNFEERKSLIKCIYDSTLKNNTWGNYFQNEMPQETLDILSENMALGAARDLRKNILMACSNAIKENINQLLPRHVENNVSKTKMPWDLSGDYK